MPEELDFVWMSKIKMSLIVPFSILSVSQSSCLIEILCLFFLLFLFKDWQSMIEPCYKRLINLTCLGSMLKDV